MEEEVGAVTPLSELLSARDGAAKPEPAPEAEKPSAAPPDAVSPPDPPAPKEPDHEPAMIPRQAYHAEKTKRQELEAKLAALEAKHAEKPQEQQPKIPDVLDDGFGQHIEDRFAQMDWQMRVSLSTNAMRGQHKDYDEIEAIYADAAHKGLVPRIPHNHPAPAQFAYEVGKRFKIANDVGDDLGAYEAKLKAKWDAEAKAAEAERLKAKESAVMDTLAGERSATPDKGAEGWSPKPLGELLKKKRA